MEFRQLQTFAAVVETGSFSRAAQILQISQPTASLHIQQLEEELGSQLIRRTTKSIDITPVGRRVYEYARNILRMEKRIREECADAGGHSVHLGASTIPSGYILPEVLAGFRKTYPQTHFIIDQGDSSQIIQKLESGLIDLAVAGMEPDSITLDATPFYQDEMILITPPSARFRTLKEELSTLGEAGEDSYEGEILSLLLREPFILREEGSGSLKAGEQAMEEMGVQEEDLHITARMNDTEAIKNMVAGGLGISMISEKAARSDLKQGRLLSFRFPGEGCHRSFYLIRRSGLALGEDADRFYRYVLGFYHLSS